MRIAAPDGAVAGMEVKSAQTGRTTRYDGRVVEVTNPQHAKALLDQGAFPASLSGQTRRSVGYRCDDCGFGSFFSTCSRCRGTCSKETD